MKNLIFNATCIHFLYLLLGFISISFLSKSLPLQEFGEYVYYLSFIAIIAIPVGKGYTLALLKVYTTHIPDPKKSKNTSTKYESYAMVGFVALAIVVAAVSKEFISPLLVLCVVLIRLKLSRSKAFLKAYTQVNLAEIPEKIFQPLTFLVLSICVLYTYSNVSAEIILFVYLISLIITWGFQSAIALWARNKMNLDYNMSITLLHQKTIFYDNIPSFLADNMVSVIFAQAGVLFVGFLLGAEFAGYYRVAERMAQLAIIPAVVINTIAVRKVPELYKMGNKLKDLARYMKVNARLSFTASLIIVLLYIEGGELAMGLLFTQKISENAFLIGLVLMLSQLVSSYFGPSGTLLSMTDYQKVNAILGILITSGILLLAYPTIFYYGIIGLPFLFLVMAILRATFQGYFIYRKLGFRIGCL